MANEKQIKARLQQKHDIEANWNLATNFVPKQGELIVYDKDENYSYERMKIGDGEKTVDALPFIDAHAFDENGVIKQNALPEGYPYVTSGEVLPMTNVSIDSSSEGIIVDKFSLVEGAEYEVIWNGASYTCTGVEFSLDGISLICLGDLADFEDREPTDYPFLVACITDEAMAEDLGAYGLVVPYENLTDVNLSINGTIFHQIDKKFIPTPDVVTNIVNGDNIGSIRSRYAQPNDDEYQIGESATALGYLTKASGDYSHAECEYTTASGFSSHAEGSNTKASGDYSHAEGFNTTASGNYSHAEGFNTTASGANSHAEGHRTTASGYYSHAEGEVTIASSGHQHVQGKYNIKDTSASYAHIVGNGDNDALRSNAHTLDWDGNAWFQGDVYVGSTSGTNKDEGSKKLVTEADLASLTASDVGALPNTTVIPSIAGLATETYVNNIASTKVDKIDGKGLSTNDYTTTEKNKLSGIASGAEVNQNAFSNVVVGSTTIAADSKTDSLTIAAGTGISVAGDATNDKVTITNSGVRSVATGSSNGTISVNTNGTAVDVAIKGLGSAAYTASTAYDAAGTAKAKADAALASAKTYADGIKNDLLNGAGSAYDTLKELGELIDTNVDAIDALETVAAGKADKTHTHTIANVSGLQSALDGKAASSHGTHVSYSTTAPVIDGTASAGSASTVARSDHKHPTDTSRASKTEFDTHTGNTTVHITSAERTNWNAAKTHANSAHAPSNAEKNQNAFSNVKVGSTTIVADSTTDTLTLVAGTNVTITPDATNDKITISATDTNTTYSAGAGISLSGTTFSNSGVRSISTGSSNGTISVNTNGTAVDVAIKGLGSAAYTASTAYDAAGTAQTKADAALKSAKTYADGIKNDLLGKADKTHTHVIADVSGLQSSLDAKVPTSRTINGKALTTNISLTASDVGALPDTTVIPSIDGLATKEYVNTKIQNALGAIGIAEDGEY